MFFINSICYEIVVFLNFTRFFVRLLEINQYILYNIIYKEGDEWKKV